MFVFSQFVLTRNLRLHVPRVTSIGQRGLCSLQFCSSPKLAFWSGNVYNCLCLSEFPNSLQPAIIVLAVISSFLSVTNDSPTVCSLLGFDGRVSKKLSAELDQTTPVCVIPTFALEELHKVLAGPCIKCLDRHDFQSFLLFVLMKLRTALGSTWLNNLHELRRVSVLFHFFILISVFTSKHVLMQLPENRILPHKFRLTLRVFFSSSSGCHPA